MIDEKRIIQARLLLENLEAGNTVAAKDNLSALCAIGESRLFKEIGKLTRGLHDTLNSFQLDKRITSLAAQDIPGAKDNLEYVLKSTADAANKTMDVVEAGISIVDKIRDQAIELNESWVNVKSKDIEEVEFRSLCDSTEGFISNTADKSVELRKLLEDALMAQGFQDLTGQVIKRVIQLVQEIEESLIETIKTFGDMTEYEDAANQTKVTVGVQGPVVDTNNRDDVVKNQDDVDDLLSSLGF